MVQRVRPRSTVFNRSPVLITESAEEFERFHDALNDELKPRGPLERHLVEDITEKAWEVRRLGRVKTSLINSAFRRALKTILDWVSEQPENRIRFESETHELAGQWFSDERVKKRDFGDTQAVQAR